MKSRSALTVALATAVWTLALPATPNAKQQGASGAPDSDPAGIEMLSKRAGSESGAPTTPAVLGAPECAQQHSGQTAAASTPEVGSTNVPLKILPSGILELGLVRVDKQRGSVTIPAFVNLREGIVEYVLVTSGGKTHESVLRTDAEPHHIHVAMLLLGARGAGTNELPADPALSLPGDAIIVEVVWKKGAKERRVRAESLVLDRKRKSAAAKGDWTYTGSRIREDGFAAQADGSIISLITDVDALVNNPRPGREDDDRWLSKATNLPEFNEPVEVVITLKDNRKKR